MPVAIQSTALPSEVLMIAETQWLFTEAELLQTPSIIQGLPPELERENRSKGVNFVLQVGIMLKLPQITLATASIFLHRFYMRHPMKIERDSPNGFHHYEVGATSLFLATKVEENCRKMRELVIACCRVAQKDPHKMVDEYDKEYWRWRDVVLFNEDLMLEALCFDLSLEPPYKTLFDHLMYFGKENNHNLRNAAWAFLNDSYLTTLCLLFPSKTIATSALYAAAKQCAVTFPDDESGRPWWDTVGVELGQIRRACNYMASIYDGTSSKAGKKVTLYNRLHEVGDNELDKTRAIALGADSALTPRENATDGITIPYGVDETDGKRDAKNDWDGQADVRPENVSNGAAHGATTLISQQAQINSPSKRQKLGCSSNGFERKAARPLLSTQPDGTAGHLNEPSDSQNEISFKLDDVSEEGEVEA